MFQHIYSDLSDTCYNVITSVTMEILGSIDGVLKSVWPEIDLANLLGILLPLLVGSDFPFYCETLF